MGRNSSIIKHSRTQKGLVLLALNGYQMFPAPGEKVNAVTAFALSVSHWTSPFAWNDAP